MTQKLHLELAAREHRRAAEVGMATCIGCAASHLVTEELAHRWGRTTASEW